MESRTMTEEELRVEENTNADQITALVAEEKSTPAAALKVQMDEEIIPTENVLRRHIKEDPKKKVLAKHRLWLDNLQHEYPLPFHPFRIGVYIRYYNQTKHKNYIEKHIQQFTDDIALCKRWTLVDFYIDKGMTAPKMENSKEWCRLLSDCFAGKVDLIVTQKVSNVSNDADELSFIVRLLAAQKHPVGIYFISEDIFSLASYYRDDLLDRGMFPEGIEPLPEDELDEPMLDGQQALALPGDDDAAGDADTVAYDDATTDGDTTIYGDHAGNISPPEENDRRETDA